MMVWSQIAIAQSELSIYPTVPYSELNAIAVEGDFIYTAGDCNSALISTDGGENWETIEVEKLVANIRILPGSNGSKAVYQFIDGVYELDAFTLEFTEISSSSLFLSSGSYISVETDDENVYVISSQNIHRGKVGEYDWEKIADFDFDNNSVLRTDITENYLHVGTLNGQFFNVHLETNEVVEKNDFMNRISAFDMVNDDLGYFTIQSFSNPIKTTDGGETYTALENLPENINVKGYGDNVIMTINTNRIYVSTDGGASATYIPTPRDGTYDLIFSNYMTEDGTLYLAGRSSVIAKTEDFGMSFVNLNSYKRENLMDINIHSSGTGVAVGGNYSIIKTENGGAQWELTDIPLEEGNFLNAALVLAQGKYIVAGSDALVIVENDQVVHTVERGLDALHYSNSGDYLIGLQSSNNDYSIIKSTDGGLSWNTKAFLPGYSFNISQSSNGKIYVPGLDGDIYTSTDDGETWEIERFGVDLDVTRVLFYDDNIGIATTGTQLYKTEDGGQTATQIASGYIIRNMHFVNEDQIIYTTAQNAMTNVFESIDGGESFERVKTFCSQSFNSFKDEDNVVWFAQNGGHINNYQPQGTSSTQKIIPTSTILYPNPTSVNQPFQIDLNEEVTQVTFTTITGESLKTVRPDISNIISTEGLPAGMYTLTIETLQHTVAYAKLIIIE